LKGYKYEIFILVEEKDSVALSQARRALEELLELINHVANVEYRAASI